MTSINEVIHQLENLGEIEVLRRLGGRIYDYDQQLKEQVILWLKEKEIERQKSQNKIASRATAAAWISALAAAISAIALAILMLCNKNP